MVGCLRYTELVSIRTADKYKTSVFVNLRRLSVESGMFARPCQRLLTG